MREEVLNALNTRCDQDNHSQDDVKVQVPLLLSTQKVIAPVQALHVVCDTDLGVRRGDDHHHRSEKNSPHRCIVDAKIHIVSVHSVQLLIK